jgi:hypothetical protein
VRQETDSTGVKSDTGGVELASLEAAVPVTSQPVAVSRPAEWKVWTLWGLLFVLFVGIYLCFGRSSHTDGKFPIFS